MSTFQILVNLFAYASFSLGTLLVWPSRRNVMGWLAFPFFVVAYVIPLAVVNYTDFGSAESIDRLTTMNALAALASLVGLVLGSTFTVRGRASRGPGPTPTAPAIGFRDRQVLRAMTAGCTLMSLCFLWMGVVPLFASEPLLAKFFRGEYKERYDQVAVVYRFSQTLLATALPAALALLVQRRSLRLVLAVAWALGLFAVSLNRGTVVAGLVLLIAVWCGRTRLRMAVFLVASTLVYALGSSVYALIGIVVADDFDPWLEIARGAPDVADHLMFLDAFLRSPTWSYGMTFVGGLIPGNFRFNPSVFTLAVVNGNPDVSEIASGGLRLPPSLAGFAAFGWAGVVLVPLFSGFLAGMFTNLLRRLQRGPMVQQVASLLWYQVYALFFISFFAMSYLNLISILVLAYISTNPASIVRFIPPRRQPTRATRSEPDFRTLPSQA